VGLDVEPRVLLFANPVHLVVKAQPANPHWVHHREQETEVRWVGPSMNSKFVAENLEAEEGVLGSPLL
jgi:hypothetical protein